MPVMAFRAAIGMSDLTTEPHVSLCASLFGPQDLDGLRAAIAQVAAATRPFDVTYDTGAPVTGDTAGMILVTPSEPLLSLRQALVEATHGLIRSAADPARPFRPHVTLYQDANPVEAEMARHLAADFDFGQGFPAVSLDLVGRVGPPREGTRRILDAFALSG